MLSRSEVELYKNDGYVVPSFQLSEPKLKVIEQALGELLEQNPGKPNDGMPGAHIVNGNPDGIKGHRDFLALAMDADILDVVQSAIGQDIVLWSTQVFCKNGGVGRKIPWHQDAQYIPIEPLETCTVWIALDHISPENGCLRVIPQSHKEREIFVHEQISDGDLALDLAVRNSDELEQHAVDVVLKPGQMVVFDVMLVHGSEANSSSKRRAGVALRYMPSTSVFDRTKNRLLPGARPIDYSKRPIWLCRGVDRSGKNDFVVGHIG